MHHEHGGTLSHAVNLPSSQGLIESMSAALPMGEPIRVDDSGLPP